MLRAADGGERDLTFVGSVDRPSPRPGPAFEEQIAQWLAAAPEEEDAALVSDDESPDGLAIDLTAWTPPADLPPLASSAPARAPAAATASVTASVTAAVTTAVTAAVPPVVTAGAAPVLPTVAMPALSPGAGLPTQVMAVPVAG